jgi:monoamine oxidase
VPRPGRGSAHVAVRGVAGTVGRIHWAGAECSPQWNGYMEGAVGSGEAAAAAATAVLVVTLP